MYKEDIMSSVEAFSTMGEYLLSFEYPTVLNLPHGTHDIPTYIMIPHGTEYPPRYLRQPPRYS